MTAHLYSAHLFTTAHLMGRFWNYAVSQQHVCAVLLKMISAPHCDEQEAPAAAINATREHTVGGLAKYLLCICKSCCGRGKQFTMREKLVRGVFK